MKVRLFFSIFTFFCLAIVLILYTFLNHQTPQLLSPIISKSKFKYADNIWFPKLAPKNASASQIEELTASSAFFIDSQTGDVLFEKNSAQKLPIASLTKIMTAVVALEYHDLNKEFYVSEYASMMEPDKMFLVAGEKLTLEDLLAGLFLVSGNDAAEVIAEGTTGRREEFINLMNSKAAQLGMKNTHFINPTGLEEEEGTKYSQSSAYDLAILSRYAAYKWPQLLEITKKPTIYLPANAKHQAYSLETGINLVTSLEGVVGFKTGFTPSAGLTLVTIAERNGKQVLGVLLGSTHRREDAKMLLEYSFKKLGV